MRWGADKCGDPSWATTHLWLEANAHAGYADGSVAAAPTSRYHGLLLVRAPLPIGRWHLVSLLDEALEAGTSRFALSTMFGPDGLRSDGLRRCTGFDPAPWPTWRYEDAGVVITREILLPRDQELVLVRWRLEDAPVPEVKLRVRPLLSCRDYHHVRSRSWGVNTQTELARGMAAWRPNPDAPPVRALHSGEYRHAPLWHEKVQYELDRARGEEPEEDLWSPGELTFSLAKGSRAYVAFTAGDLDRVNFDKLWDAERRRRDEWSGRRPAGHRILRRIWDASQVYVADEAEPPQIIAGFPWFTAWARDTFTALPGLCLVPGEHDAAREILVSSAHAVSEGMIPNVLGEGGHPPRFDAMDVSLWFILAVSQYARYTRDWGTVRRELWPAVKEIIEGYRRGTRHGIHVDWDGLVTGGAEGVHLTWMDADTNGKAITPRRGKPVEIQGLWVDALATAGSLARKFSERDFAGQCDTDKQRAIDSFRRRFWYEPGGYLYDVVDGPDGDDASFRPNQIFAIAADHELVDHERARRVMRRVREKLLVPGGVRTLAPDDPHARDVAYHQGTAWPYLLAPFVTAWMRAHDGSADARAEALELLGTVEPALEQTCLGHLPEILDADPPHAARGCFAQAWSAGVILAAYAELLGLTPPALDESPLSPSLIRSRAARAWVAGTGLALAITGGVSSAIVIARTWLRHRPRRRLFA